MKNSQVCCLLRKLKGFTPRASPGTFFGILLVNTYSPENEFYSQEKFVQVYEKNP